MEQQAVAETSAQAEYPILLLVSEDWADITRGAVVNLSAVDVSIVFPCGLAIIDRDGNLLPETVKVDIQVMQVSEDGLESAEWVDSFSGDWTLNSLDPYAAAIQLAGEGLVRIRVRKSSPSCDYARVDTVLKVSLKKNAASEGDQRETKSELWARMDRSLAEKERQARILHHRLARIEEALGLAPYVSGL
ncbi:MULTISPECIES: hypothetical protein [Pseudomonas]|uniref:Uncharacterized protein n=2 Tax=Pseudomonas TaxID=286 RepID=A0A7W2LZY2_9PSED|nr:MULTISPECIES: hypothetical protein [Pseudomonas]MBA6134810.1 hypothetical protein [Pseudomonas juntendi]MBA6150158.1 hypothetical protein [Pseudomonas juntendi]UXH41639.1 hypothetical protein N5C08_08975 [Pseudomonas promysalinigenes]